MSTLINFASLSHTELFEALQSNANGLSETEVAKRIPQSTEQHGQIPFLKDVLLLLYQFKSPLVLLLVFGLLMSSALGDMANALIIFSILLLSGMLGFIQERKAGKAAEQLRKLVQSKANVRRSSKIQEIEISKVVYGDIILLSAGDIIPADAIVMESNDLYVNESVLTGESFPAEKNAVIAFPNSISGPAKNLLYKGTHVVSGTAVAIAVVTGAATEIGQIEIKSAQIIENTAFESGLKNFGMLLMRVAMILSGGILVFNISMGKPAIDSVLFALALSLGITPELLPAILTITLSSGAKRLAREKVIVKKLASIQNLGSIDVLCSDKTGTLTEGIVNISAFISANGSTWDEVAKYAYINSCFESGYHNPIDEAIRQHMITNISDYTKLDEVPFDFIRKRLSIVASTGGRHIMITKGAIGPVTNVCNTVKLPDGSIFPFSSYQKEIGKKVNELNVSGYRVIGIACKDVTGDPVISKDDETDMTFLGIIAINDPLKKDIADNIKALKEKDISLKIITGDNITTAVSVASRIDIPAQRVMSGAQMDQLDDESLAIRVNDIDVFAETTPSQKERIVRSLQRRGHVTGYLGDGINDAPALKAADVGISVNNAADIAKESSDIILLEKSLGAVMTGIIEGRKTYLNTRKYILFTISSNFGNMISMAVASALLPFLPLLPAQILLTNFLTDLPALSIASDKVDSELLNKPRKWNIDLIKKFMIIFGLESSFFDLVTFLMLLKVLNANVTIFRTGWFVESVITGVLTLFVIRTKMIFIRSKPGKALIVTGLFVGLFVLSLPFTAFSSWIGFGNIPITTLVYMLTIAVGYTVCIECTKRVVFRRLQY